MTRVVVWFSAGAASAVAAKLTLHPHPEAVIAYTDPGNEHPDNQRFISDCERWFGKEVVQLKSSSYEDAWEVWEKRRFLVSTGGALCTMEMKKRVRQEFEQAGDAQVFGFTAEEQARASSFRRQNPEVDLRTPLIERGLSKDDCLALIEKAGIELPAMYQLGYRNNNCVGCVKGGIGYWNKIRRDFPETFARMAKLEREIGATVLRNRNRFGGEPVYMGRLYLDELDPERGNHADEPSFECSVLCQDVEAEVLA